MSDKKKTFEELVATLPDDLGTSMLAVSEMPEHKTTAERVVQQLHQERFPEEYPVNQRVLPKWPQMLVAGEPVTPEQAKEIIRRTDTFFLHGGGNDHDWNDAVRKALYMSPSPTYQKDEKRDYDKIYAYDERWRKQWGSLVAEYVCNSWLSSSFIGGPHGWVHPDGKIGYTDNVGKWPSMEELVSEWKYIAKAFPFLRLGVVVMSGECGEEDRKPVFSIMVGEGAASLMDPYRVDVHEGFEVPNARSLEEEMKDYNKPIRLREHGAPPQWIEEWAIRAKDLFEEDYRKTFGAP